DPAQERETREEPDREWRRDLLCASQDTPDDPILDEDLEPLGDAGRPLAPPLHPSQVLGGQPGLAQRRSEHIRGSDCILDREVDAYAADRGHRVRRITDTEEARAIPSTQPVHPDGEQLDLVPITQLADTVSGERRELRDAVAERRQPSLL